MTMRLSAAWRSHSSRVALSAPMLAWAMLAPGSALAQASDSQGAASAEAPAAADQADGTDEILVTAQFREQNLQETPLAITAVSGAMLEARSQTNIADVANQAPSVTLKPQGAAFGPALGANIRGVGQFDFNPALEPGVGMYVDDVYYATLSGSILDLLDLDRVEILRGPQGTLAGKNSIGGAIKLYSQKPIGSNTGYVQAAYGSRDRLDLRASADIGLTDIASLRIAGVSKRQDGYIDRLDFGCVNPPGSALNPAVGGVAPRVSSNNDCVMARESAVNYSAARAQLRFQPSDAIDINLIADYTHDDRVVAGSVLVEGTNAPGAAATPNNTSVFNPTPWIRGSATAVPLDNRFLCGKYCNYASFYSPAGAWLGPVATGFPLVETINDGRVDFEGWGISGQVDWDVLDELQLQSITAYREYTNRFSNDDDLSPLAASNGRGDLTFWSFSQELRLNGSAFDNAIEYTLGGFYQDQRSVYATFQDLRYPVIPLQFQGDDPVNADTIAAFAHLTWHLTDKLSFNGGLRYTDEHKDYTFSRTNRDGTPNAFLGALNGVTGDFDGDRWDYRANVQYAWTDDLMTYAQVSTGFKGGGISPRPFNVAQVVPFGPETLTAYEIGLKSDLFDRLARFNVAAFLSKYKGIQLTLLSCPQFGGPGPCAVPQNAGDADIKGFEAELSLRPVDGLSIDGALSYLDFDYTSINAQAGGTTNPTGPQLDDVPPYTPEWKWSVGAQYEFYLGDSGSITPRIDASYQSTVFSGSSNTNLERIPSYTLANARLTWRNAGEDLEVSAELTNIFDEYYFLTAFDLTGAGAGYANAQPGRPREWALSIKKKF
ncbi:TonB-dependent receptor [Tsuneonella sp. HG222]